LQQCVICTGDSKNNIYHLLLSMTTHFSQNWLQRIT
jgi:hypothetical protein